jgi:uncharacterized membrane protein (GlpM family)
MIISKILITILVVTLLSVVAERGGPKLAGILAGYPAGSAISLFFFGIELGPEFAGQSALYNVAGMVALMTFLYIYYLVTVRIPIQRRWVAIISGVTAAAAGFLLMASLLRLMNLPPLAGIGLTMLVIPLFQHLFNRIGNAGIPKRVQLGPRVLLFRASISAVVIVLVTSVAALVGAQWAGLFSAFPATVLPLVLIVHRTYGVEQAHTIIKNVPLGLWSLVLYSISVSLSYPRLGLGWGTFASFGVATLYLLALASARAKRTSTGSRQARTKLV